MARRPVFVTKKFAPFYEEINTEFHYFNGFSVSQQRKSIDSLHLEFQRLYPGKKILEVSTKSINTTGQELSAFNLRLLHGGKWYSVESVFQAGKVFTDGGPFPDLLDKSGSEIKKDERLKESGELSGFTLFGEPFPLEPKTFFYDWIYICALRDNPSLAETLLLYDAFTDISFNPEKSLNCQARTAAVYVSLARENLLQEALKSPDAFREIVYGTKDNETGRNAAYQEEEYEQLRLEL